MSTKELLVKSKEILRERGINRDGSFVGPDGCVCALGAAYLATGAVIDQETTLLSRPFLKFPNDWDREGYAAVSQILHEVVYDEYGFYSVPRLNDDSATDDEVFEFFDKAIAKAE